MLDALVLSGGRFETERFPHLGPPAGGKAMLPILGRPMVEWVVRALRASPRIGQIVVVGSPALATPALLKLDACLVLETGDISGNLAAGLKVLGPSERILGVSGDLPLLSPAAVEDLALHAPSADVVFPFVEREEVLEAFPQREWIFSSTPDGHLTGCSAALFRPDAVRSNWRWVRDLLDARRKSPMGLAMMAGPGLAVRYLLRRLRVADVERRLSALLRLDGRGYRTRFAELAMDVDKASDIPLVEEALRSQADC